MIEVKVGDKIKYDSEHSILTWYGVVEKVNPKSVIVACSESLRTERVMKKDIVCVY